MSHFIDICFICLKNSADLTFIKCRHTNETSFEDKLKYFLPGIELESNIPKYICAKCGRNLNKVSEFKQKCLRNMAAYDKYAQQITASNSSHKNLNPDFVCEKEDEELSEIDEDAVDSKDFVIDQEINKELTSNDELDSLLYDIKKDDPESDVCLKNEIKEENVQIKSNENENIGEQGNVCQKFGNFEDPKKHESYNNKLYTCEVCNKSFRHSKLLKRHKFIHTGEKSFTCDVCNKSFIHLATFKAHKLVHTGEKPFICEVCNLSFGYSSVLKQHERIHTGEKPFTCEICKKTFRHLSNFNAHKLIHTNEKPFTCGVCNKSFRQLIHLQQHHLTHTGEKPFTCEVCKKSFQRKTVLNRHKLVHTDEKSFT